MRTPLFLTFDDGPDPQWTPRVAELLARHGATATFFVLGWRVRESPAIVGELLASGHRIELHGDAHLAHDLVTPDQLATDTEDALRVLAGLGVEPEWWRLPFGRSGPASRALADQHGLRLAGWDADTNDWRGDGWRNQPAQVSDAAERGGVVLLHDATVPGIGRTTALNTLEITDELLKVAGRHGTPVAVLPPASDTTFRIPSSAPRSPFARTDATRRAWLRREAEADGIVGPGGDRGGIERNLTGRRHDRLDADGSGARDRSGPGVDDAPDA